MCRAQTGKNAEGQVETANKHLCRKAHHAGRNAEVGDEPQCSRRESRSDTHNQSVQVRLSEAIQKEVRDDKIVTTREREVQSVRVISAETNIGVENRRLAPMAKKLKHGDTGIDRIRLEMRVTREELSKEAAVSIT